MPSNDCVLSVVVTVVSDTTASSDTRHLEGCLQALGEQAKPPSEVLVTCDSKLEGIDTLERRFPQIRFIRVPSFRIPRYGPSREHHDELRGIGIRASQGRLIALLEDHGHPDPHWCEKIVETHGAVPHAAIGGAMENGIDRPLNWAIYFCDFGRYQNRVPRGPADFVSDANVSYKREALEKVGGSWATAYNETRVHHALRAAGEVLWLSPDIVVYQHRQGLRLGTALLERYVWGRSYAATRTAGLPVTRRAIFAAICPVLPFLLIYRQLKTVLRTGRNRTQFLTAVPLTFLLLIAWACGEFSGYVSGRPTG